jgi:Flp pilus assembly protein TadD
VKRLVTFLTLVVIVATGAHAATKPVKTTTASPAVTDSLVLLERAVAKDSTRFDNLYQLGVIYLDRGYNAEAAQVFAKANQLKPKDVKVLVNLGVALDNMNKGDQARARYKQAIALSPDDPLANCRLASSVYAQGRTSDATGLLREMIAKHPRWSCAYFTMGVAFADAGLYRDAVRMWKKVIELEPDSPEAQSAKESVEVLEGVLKGQ